MVMARSDYEDRPFNGLALRLHRIARRLTAEEAVAALGVKGCKIARSTLFRWETGERIPTDRTVLRKLAMVYRCNIEAFYHEPLVTFAGAPPPEAPRPVRKKRRKRRPQA